MPKTPEEYVQNLIELTGKKLEYMGLYHELTVRQGTAATEDTVGELEALTARKQELIGLVDKLDEEYEVYYSRFKSVLGVARLNDFKGQLPGNMKRLKELTAQIMSLVRDIQRLDENNVRKGKQVLEELQSKMKGVNTGKRAVAGYLQKPAPTVSYYFDKKIGK